MSTTKKLRLGPLPKTESIKLTFACPASLKADLDRYAAVHAQAYGETVDAVTLIPHMLEAFMAGDRGFRRGTKVPKSATQVRPLTERQDSQQQG
ncbi:TPA: DUF2274 domain-containing protein [Pseudomonas aeruginosa]|nr:DUF2274 domain-containing protein [Pseudomonas aeruginosa]HEN8489097.1 DUF2274 domain-containing protein [Pseudomonas aeruginosa]HEN8493541.1 DUF2274 domain-containing protein [Pseudomonas aeruginosa]HEN8498199.1 DUF2274 domain-containing protein [Pseudomonas aeruginosa]